MTAVHETITRAGAEQPGSINQPELIVARLDALAHHLADILPPLLPVAS